MSFVISATNVENELLKTRISLKSVSYLLVSKCGVSGVRVVAIFSDFDNAIKYMIREAVNYYRDEYEDFLEGEEVSDESYIDFVRSQINDSGEIIPIHHIDLTKPVYVMKDSGYLSTGNPSEFVTNSEVYWGAIMKSSYDRVKKEINDYLLKIDPPLPDLKQFIQHNNVE